MTHKILATILFGTSLSCGLHASAAQPTPAATFGIAHRYPLGGEGGWDLLAVDAQRHHLFVTRSTHIQVVDTNTDKLAGDIPDMDGVHAVAVAEDLNVAFASNGKTNSVAVFDLDTLKVLTQIKVSGSNPDAILYDTKSRHVLAFNGRSSNASVIDAISRKEIATINLPGKPELAVSNNAGRVFVNIEDKNEIAVIDSVASKVVTRYALGGGTEPTGLAIDIPHQRLFAVCGNGKMEILDAKSGKIIAEVAIGDKPDSAAFDEKLGLAFSSNGEGTLTVIKENDLNHFSVTQQLATKKGARTMAYDPATHQVYLVTAEYGTAAPATAGQPKPRPPVVPGSFELLVVAPK
jgi:DNA-binding beta-propeller fold protein YncE